MPLPQSHTYLLDAVSSSSPLREYWNRPVNARSRAGFLCGAGQCAEAGIWMRCRDICSDRMPYPHVICSRNPAGSRLSPPREQAGLAGKLQWKRSADPWSPRGGHGRMSFDEKRLALDRRIIMRPVKAELDLRRTGLSCLSGGEFRECVHHTSTRAVEILEICRAIGEMRTKDAGFGLGHGGCPRDSYPP